MAISVVQAIKSAGSSVSFLSPTTAGNCVAVVVCDRGSTGTATVTAVKLGGAAGNFGSSPAANGGGTGTANVLSSIWADPNCAGGQTAIAATITNGNDPVIFAYEISGLATASVVDQTAASATTTGSTFSSGSTATTTQATEIWIGGAAGVSVTLGAPAGYTNQTQNGAATVRGEAGFQIVSSTGAAVYNSTLSGSASHSAAIVTLKGTSNVNVSLTTAQVNVSAPAPTPKVGPPLAVARVSVNTLPVTVGIVVSVPLTTARVNIAAHPLTLPVLLTTARVSVAARPVTPAVNVSVPLATARVTVAAHPLAISRQLLISLASHSGTDDYGNSFPQGILATAGIIEGPEFIGSDFIITTSGAFWYSGTPGAGNLVASVAPDTTAADPFGNTVTGGGYAVYGIDGIAFLSEGAIQFGPDAAHITGGFASQIDGATSGQMIVNSGGQTLIDPTSEIALASQGVSGAAGGQISILAGKTVLNNHGAPIPIPGISSGIATLPQDGNSGSSWAAGERAFMNSSWVDNINGNFQTIITALINAGIIT